MARRKLYGQFHQPSHILRYYPRPRLGRRHAERRHRRPAERRLDHHAAVRP